MIDMDSFARRFRKPRMETQEEINQRMLSVELAVKEALSARGEAHFTDQEFPPNDQSLFLDPANPPLKLRVSFLNCYALLFLSNCLFVLNLSSFLAPGGV